MPDYEFYCTHEGCGLKGKIVLRKFHMNDEKHGNCLECGSLLQRKLGNFVDQYKGSDFTRSADAKEEVDVWK
jgi:predicted nucleic acid-binding Zn ribbon protein